MVRVGKYIIVSVMNVKCCIMFDSIIPHSSFLTVYPEQVIISAGFFKLFCDDGVIPQVDTFGWSETFNISSNPDDQQLILRVLFGE